MTMLERSLQAWLMFGGAAVAAMRLAGRCGDALAPRGAVALCLPFALIMPVGVLLILAYWRDHEVPVGEAIGRAVLIALTGAVVAALLYSCQS